MNKQSQRYFTLTIIVQCLLLVSINAQDDKTMEWKSTIQPGQIKYIPNVSYLGQGYNLYYGNPQSINGLDPGYRNVPIVELQYQDNLWDAVTPDRAYFIPDGVRLTTEKSCLISFASKEITTIKQYQDNLATQVSGNGEIFASSFSASADFKLMHDDLSSSNTQYIQSQATCSVFHLDFYNNYASLPLLSRQVVDKIKFLNSKSEYLNEEDYYYDFFESWGTHVATSVQLGSLYGYKFSMKSSEVQHQYSLGLDITVGASLYGVSGKVSTSYEEQQLNSFKSAMKGWSSYSIGAIPSAEQDAVKWAMQTLDRPMPISTQLTPIYTFIAQYQNNTEIGIDSAALLNVSNKMKIYLDKYCRNVLNFQSKVSSCTGYANQSTDPLVNKKRIKNIKSGKNIQSNTTTLTVLQKTEDLQSADQQFQLSRPINNENAYEIQLNYDYSSLCLGVDSVADNKPVIVKTCSQDSTTLFEIEDIGQGFSYIKPIGSQYFLTIESTSNLSDLADNARIILTKNKSTCKGCTFFQLQSF